MKRYAGSLPSPREYRRLGFVSLRLNSVAIALGCSISAAEGPVGEQRTGGVRFGSDAFCEIAAHAQVHAAARFLHGASPPVALPSVPFSVNSAIAPITCRVRSCNGSVCLSSPPNAASMPLACMILSCSQIPASRRPARSATGPCPASSRAGLWWGRRGCSIPVHSRASSRNLSGAGRRQ